MTTTNFFFSHNIIMKIIVSSNGLSGKICLLRAICEAAATPFMIGNDNTLFDEILHIFFTYEINSKQTLNFDRFQIFIHCRPSTSKDPISDHFDNEYLRAEQLGRTNEPCHRIFRSCIRSPLDIISSQFHFQSDEE